MSVATKLRVLPKMVLTFPNDLPGLKGVRRFRLEPLGDGTNPNPFGRLIALEPVLLGEKEPCGQVQLIVAAPGLVWPEFAVEITDATQDLLQIEDREDVAVVVVVTLSDSLKRSTANLLAPIVINTRTFLATQIVPAHLDNGERRLIHTPLPEQLLGR